MGGDLDKFDSASMYDFQFLRSIYCLKNGINEEEEKNEITTTDDLDQLYAKMKPLEG